MAGKGRQRVSSTREGVCHNLGKGHKPCQGLRRVSLATPSLTTTRQSSGRSHHREAVALTMYCTLYTASCRHHRTVLLVMLCR